MLKRKIQTLAKLCENFNVLYAEDDEMIKENMYFFLSTLFNKVDLVSDGFEAWEKYQVNQYDLVITDMYMPKLSGMELIKKIKDYNQKQIIAIQSANFESESLLELMHYSVNHFIPKPFDTEKALDVIYNATQDIVEQKRIQNRLDFIKSMGLDVDQHFQNSIKNHFEKGPIVALLMENNDSLSIISYTQNIQRLFGINLCDMSSSSGLLELIHEEDRESYKEKNKTAIEENKDYIEHLSYRLLASDGSFKWVKDNTIIINDEIMQKQFLITYLVDITTEKNLEKELKHTIERWEFGIDGNGDGLWDWDIVTDEVYFSLQWKKIIGFEVDEITNSLSEWKERVHPDDLQEVYMQIQKHLDGKTQYYQCNHRMLCKDGTYKWIVDKGAVAKRDIDGKPLRMIGTHRDLAE